MSEIFPCAFWASIQLDFPACTRRTAAATPDFSGGLREGTSFGSGPVFNITTLPSTRAALACRHQRKLNHSPLVTLAGSRTRGAYSKSYLVFDGSSSPARRRFLMLEARFYAVSIAIIRECDLEHICEAAPLVHSGGLQKPLELRSNPETEPDGFSCLHEM